MKGFIAIADLEIKRWKEERDYFITLSISMLLFYFTYRSKLPNRFDLLFQFVEMRLYIVIMTK